ncbi:hypothetical protein HN682_09545, partial [Candidatus Peregrinibacteria bacterium]|nr:hypothetical protein [Candidatus Peregrinibacteria bacterium]
NTNDPNQALEVNGSIRISNTDARLEIHDTSGDDFRIQNQNGTLKFVNSTSDREDIAITGDGRVGIDESTPEGKLHVYLSNDTSNNDVSAVFEGEDHSIVRIKGTGQRTVNFVDSNNNLDWLTGMDDSNGSGGDANDYVIKQTANSVPEFIIGTSGKVGVNTNNPERMLDVYSTSLNLGFRVQDPTSYIMTSTIAGSPVLEMQDDDGSAFLRFKRGSDTDNDVFLRAYNGKIGISNSQEFTPAADIMLHVNGRIKAEGIVSAGTINIEDLIVSNSFTASELTVTESLIINSLTSPSSSDIEVNKSIDFRGNDLKDASLVQSQLFQIKPSDVSPAYHAPFTTIIVPYNSGNGRHFMTDSPGAVG